MEDEHRLDRSRWHDRLLIAEAKQVVDALLASIEDPVAWISRAPEALSELAEWDSLTVGPLIDAMGDLSPRKQLLAAWMLLAIEQRAPGTIIQSQPTVDRAEKLILKQLQTGEFETRVLACLLLSLEGMTEAIEDGIASLLRSPRPELRVVAASVLAPRNRHRLTALKILLQGLRSDMPGEISIAAPVLASDPDHRSEVLSVLRKALQTATDVDGAALLWAIGRIRPPAIELVNDVADIVERPNAEPMTKVFAVQTLAHLQSGTTAGVGTLLKALREDNPPLIRYVAEALRKASEIPEEAAKILGEHLTSENVDVRRAAMYGLSLFGPAAAPALEQLVARVGIEVEMEDVDRLACTLAEIGPPVAPILGTLLRRRNVLVSATVGHVIKEMRPAGIRAVAEAMESEEDLYAAHGLIQILASLGAVAKPALPVLVRLLEQTQHQERAFMLLTALLLLGPSAADSTDAVMRCLIGGSSELASLAQRVLWSIGPDAAPALESAVDQAGGVAKQRLQSTLAGLTSANRGRFLPFLGFENDKALKVVAYILQTMIKEDRPIGMGALAKQARTERRLPAGLPQGESAFRDQIESVEEHFDIVLIDRANRATRGVTPEARVFLPELVAYLDWKAKSGLS